MALPVWKAPLVLESTTILLLLTPLLSLSVVRVLVLLLDIAILILGTLRIGALELLLEPALLPRPRLLPLLARVRFLALARTTPSSIEQSLCVLPGII